MRRVAVGGVALEGDVGVGSVGEFGDDEAVVEAEGDEVEVLEGGEGDGGGGGEFAVGGVEVDVDDVALDVDLGAGGGGRRVGGGGGDEGEEG